MNRDGAKVFGIQSFTDIDEIPEGQADLAFIATPPKNNEEILKKAHAKGIKAAFIAEVPNTSHCTDFLRQDDS